jgi:hypothetical protein
MSRDPDDVLVTIMEQAEGEIREALHQKRCHRVGRQSGSYHLGRWSVANVMLLRVSPRVLLLIMSVLFNMSLIGGNPVVRRPHLAFCIPVRCMPA